LKRTNATRSTPSFRRKFSCRHVFRQLLSVSQTNLYRLSAGSYVNELEPEGEFSSIGSAVLRHKSSAARTGSLGEHVERAS
jgi:hypothetical protein